MVLYRLIWLRYHLTANRVRQDPVWCIVLGVLFLMGAINALSILGPVSALFLELLNSEAQVIIAKQILHLLSFCLFVSWIALGVFTGISSPSITQLSDLRRFPVHLTRLHIADLLSRLVSPWVALVGVAFAWPALTLCHGKAFTSGLLALLAVALFVLTAHSTVYFIALVINVAMRRATPRILHTVAVLALAVPVIAVLGYNVDFRAFASQPLPAVLTYLRLIPSGLLVQIIFSICENTYSRLPLLVSGMLFYSILSLCAGHYLLRRLLLTGMLRFHRRDHTSGVNAFEVIAILLRRFVLRGPLPILMKELLYLARQGRYRLMSFATLLWGMTVPIVYVATDSPLRAHDLLLILPIAISSYAVFYNIFGLDCQSVALWFLLPTHRRDVIIGKNVAHLLHQWLAIVPGLAWTLALASPHTHWAVRLSLVLALLYLLMLNVTLGNVASILFPLRISVESVVGRFLSIKADVLSLSALAGSALLVGFNVYFFYHRTYMPELMALIFGAFCSLLLLAYALSLHAVVALWDRRRDAFLASF